MTGKVLTEGKDGYARLRIWHIWKNPIDYPGVVLTIANGRMAFLLTVKRSHHDWKYERLREEMLTDVKSSYVEAVLEYQDNWAQNRQGKGTNRCTIKMTIVYKLP
jgi:hypothetical protein